MKKDYSNKNIISHPSISSEELRQKKRKRIIKHTIVVVCVLVFATMNYVCWFTPVFKITTVQIDGEFDPSLNESLKPVLDKHYINKHVFFATSKRGKHDIETIVPYVMSTSITRQLPSTITVHIYQRMPAFKIQQPDGSVFVADRESFVFMNTGTGVEAPITIEVPTSTHIDLNAPLFNSDQIEKISANISQLDTKLGIKVAKVSQIGSMETQFNLYSQKRWYVMVDLNNDANNTVQTLKTFLSEKYKLEPSLSYIDLRIPNSVFYQ